MVKRLSQVVIVSDDLDAAVGFFQTTLGMPLLSRDGDRSAQIDAGDVPLVITCVEDGMGLPLNTPVPTFEVDSLAAALEQLQAAGCRIGEMRDIGSFGPRATVIEPNGAYLIFTQQPLF